METVNKLAIVVIAIFTLALGFGILRGNMKMVEESIVEPTTIPIDSVNWNDTVSHYDNGYSFDTLGYHVDVNITYRKDFADIYCRHLETPDDKFTMRIHGLMYTFDSCYADPIVRHIKFHKFELASNERLSNPRPIQEHFYARLVYEMNHQGKVVPKLKSRDKY